MTGLAARTRPRPDSNRLGHTAAATDRNLIGQVQRLARGSSRVAPVCTGATVDAAAGLLDGRRATTHGHYADELATAYPAVRVDPTPIFVQDDHVWTSGGVTAALVLALAFVEADHGAERARWVAMGLVTYLQRPGDQAQMSMFVRARRPEHDVVRRVLDHVAANPEADLSARRAGTQAGGNPRPGPQMPRPVECASRSTRSAVSSRSETSRAR
jgi:transcriptional regulator GlxA family with amidase domain